MIVLFCFCILTFNGALNQHARCLFDEKVDNDDLKFEFNDRLRQISLSGSLAYNTEYIAMQMLMRLYITRHTHKVNI